MDERSVESLVRLPELEAHPVRVPDVGPGPRPEILDGLNSIKGRVEVLRDIESEPCPFFPSPGVPRGLLITGCQQMLQHSPSLEPAVIADQNSLALRGM